MPLARRRSNELQLLFFCVFCVFCGEVAVALRAAAQGTATVRGTVVHFDGTTPAVGIVVVAIDTLGAEGNRALTGSNGGFSLTLAAPARYTLRALRIGFRPTSTSPFDVAAGETRAQHIVLSGQAFQLGEVRVESETSCRIRADSGRLVANIWDQARTALAASTLSAGDRPFQATLATYRQYTPKGERIIASESVTVTRRTTTSGFVSVPAETLAASGYFVQRGTQYAYHSPDAQALLSPEFASLHCFRVIPGGAAHPDWVGIGFRPAARRANIVDVDGALWLDRATSELRQLEYQYANLPASSGWEDASGSVAFVRLVSGDWIIGRWEIRTPVTEERVGARAGQRFVVLGTRVVGGVTRAIERDGIVFHRDSGASLVLSLRARDTVNTPEDAHVVLFGSEHEGFANNSGAVAMSGLNAGRYRALIWTPFMSWLRVSPLEHEVSVAHGAPVRMDVPLPTAGEIAARKCGISAASYSRLLYGKVKRNSGADVRFARVVVVLGSPSAPAVASGRRRTASTVQRPVEYSAPTDEFGQWQLCLRASGVVRVSVVIDGAVATTRIVNVPGGLLLTRADLTIP